MADNHSKNDGGPAFPQLDMVAGERDGHGDIIEAYLCAAGGMSLRDWFAGQWLAAAYHQGLTPREAAEEAYEYADALIRVRGDQ